MVAPILKHKSKPYLVREFTNKATFRAFSGSSNRFLTGVLTNPANLALWLARFHPELTQRDTLKVLVVNATPEVSLDDGIWYDLVPWLLGNETLKVDVTLLGTQLLEVPELAGTNTPRTNNGTLRTPPGNLNKVFKPAKLKPMSVSDYFAQLAASDSPDVIFMSDPMFSRNRWVVDGDLELLCQQRAPIGVSQRSIASALASQAWLDAHGFSPLYRTVENPFGDGHSPIEHIIPALFEIEPVLPIETMGYDDDQVEVIRQHYDIEEKYEFATDEVIAGESGKLVRNRKNMHTGALIAEAALLPPHGLMVDLSSGAIVAFKEHTLLGIMAGEEIPQELLQSYPREETYSFEQYQWSVTAIAHLFEKFRDDVLNSDDDVNEEFELAATREARGKSPVAPLWAALFQALHWNPTPVDATVEAMKPNFYLPGANGISIPVICENYKAYPLDTSDMLIKQVKQTLAANYECALVVFRSMMVIPVDGAVFACPGLILHEGDWHLFAITRDMTSVSQIKEQIAAGFSANNLLARYVDKGRVIVGLFETLISKLDGGSARQLMK